MRLAYLGILLAIANVEAFVVSKCCPPHNATGCVSYPSIEDCVGQLDPFCNTVNRDGICSDQARRDITCSALCELPNAGASNDGSDDNICMDDPNFKGQGKYACASYSDEYYNFCTEEFADRYCPIKCKKCLEPGAPCEDSITWEQNGINCNNMNTASCETDEELAFYCPRSCGKCLESSIDNHGLKIAYLGHTEEGDDEVFEREQLSFETMKAYLPACPDLVVGQGQFDPTATMRAL